MEQVERETIKLEETRKQLSNLEGPGGFFIFFIHLSTSKVVNEELVLNLTPEIQNKTFQARLKLDIMSVF